MLGISEKYLKLAKETEDKLICEGVFSRFEEIAFKNQARVMEAFSEYKVSDAHFASTTGYGYDDLGRDTLDKVFARVFGCEDAIVRHSVTSGTHALCIGLFALLRTGDTLLSVSGKPYDTLREVIGIAGEAGNGSLADFGVNYKQIELAQDGFDFEAIGDELAKNKTVKVVFVQRSKGYGIRPTFSAEQIGELVNFVRKYTDAFVMVDNCYGEFCCENEPTFFGADLCVGSLIKNPGGGMAECGAYFAGSARAVELCSYRITSPGIGREGGATLGNNRSLYKGLFYAPHTVCQALKTAVFASALLEKLGFDVYPKYNEERFDIIQTVSLGSREKLLAFCRGIQAGSPVDSHVAPEPWAMPGYADEVVMAAGTFVQGASIELSADAPVKEPYTVYLQGGLTYESGKLGILRAASFACGE